MAAIVDIILDDTATLTAADWDFDPAAGTGALLDEMDAPEGYSERTVEFDPYL